MKRCSRCGTEKELDEFSPYKRSRDGHHSWCKPCNASLQRDNYARMSPEERKELNRHRRRKDVEDRSHAKEMDRYRNDPEYRLRHRNAEGARRYGITPDEYIQRRDRPCDICGVHKVDVRCGSGMHIDHDHETGQLRGTLCDRCNRGLGMFDDDTGRLYAAWLYLKTWKKR